MKKEANTTIVVAGAVLAALVFLTIAAAPKSENSGARYTVSCTESHAVILDTHTGEAWTQRLASDAPLNSPNFYNKKEGLVEKRGFNP